jgi:uncharacterized membrane protein YphA (DoxX/SURF4 family)
MKLLPTFARILLGLVFLVFGLDGFFHYIPMPKEAPPEAAMAFGMALMKTGYLFQLLKGTETVCGALLLLNLFTPLALVVLAPVIVNIVAFNVRLAPSTSGLVICAVIVLLELYLAWKYRNAYRPILAARVSPQ